ncbi:aminomethyl-transferring glycine dehydrogenase [Fodinicola acaciae]|uniref:aminomethyl-transferring glycine dehydrogenase n=1 Tax=Fodinicola acaciae TaxID=2681555 RepID=UPI0013D5C32C|nr:aminomethyl-transferring glycine dehydrogenase [Fodinicola acaciae]
MTDRPTLDELTAGVPFARRHIGLTAADRQKMLSTVGYDSVDALLRAAVPASIWLDEPLDLPAAGTEASVTAELRAYAGRNKPMAQMIGLGYHDTITPPVIRRNVLENPSWYTAYTPYQPEISQGRLEALLTYQTMVEDLTGLPIANASLLDEATAAAEAMTLARRSSKAPKDAAFLVDSDVLPQTRAVVGTRADGLGIKLVDADLSAGLPDGDFFGVLVQYPGASGVVRDITDIVTQAHARQALVAVAADLLALTLLRTPGEFGADIAVGSSQRFGVPLMFGGPHAGYLSVRDGLQRMLPGRLVGVSKDADGAPAYRLALQTREQHIRREKATSNICTAQVLLANIAAFYAAWHGPEGLRLIAQRAHRYAAVLAAGLRNAGFQIEHESFFDTILVRTRGKAAHYVAAAAQRGINLRQAGDDLVGIACDETTTSERIAAVWSAFGVSDVDIAALDTATGDGLPEPLLRQSDYLRHEVFHSHRSETAMMRFLRGLAAKDYGLDRGMIPLGSCTMKLNAAVEMEPVSWPEFAGIHPLAPAEQTGGYAALVADLETWLAEATGYDAVSLQPNSGAQGELAGLLAIRAYHDANGDHHRDICLIPSSAHGTNAASAVMAGMKVVVVKCDDDGNVDLAHLRETLDKHRDDVAALMITYPSTHGVYEQAVAEVCAAVHDAGGQVYVDGANLNALLGVAKPGRFGGDVSHLNLHKTFCIPHGGGGPGVGPVAVRAHLADYLPGRGAVGPIAAAANGSAGILPISWAYLRLMGPDGLRAATGSAVLAANYLARRLSGHFPVLYSGTDGLVAHECILDLRPITKATGVTVDDVAKRLIDYGFHAPTMSFPVAGTLMVEPTESEDLAELDRFVAAMVAIKAEIDRVGAGEWPKDDNPLVNAPHTSATLAEDWSHPYDRQLAAFPAGVRPATKYWPPVRRIDGAYGDRNLVCSCPAPEAFED